MKIFLNDSAKDGEIVEAISTALVDAGHEVLSEVDGIAGGENWDRETGESIQQSNLFLALISPAYGRSVAAIRELKFAFEYNVPVLFVVIKPVDPSSAILEGVDYIDISTDALAGGGKILE